MVFLKSDVKTTPNAVAGVVAGGLTGADLGMVVADLHAHGARNRVMQSQVYVNRLLPEGGNNDGRRRRRRGRVRRHGTSVVVVIIGERQRHTDPGGKIIFALQGGTKRFARRTGRDVTFFDPVVAIP